MWALDEQTRLVQRLTDNAASRLLGLAPMNATAVAPLVPPREARAAMVEAVATSLVATTFAESVPTPAEARAWIAERMARRWQPVRARYPKGLGKLRRFCAEGEAARARATLAAAHLPATTGESVQQAAEALRALRSRGGDSLEAANLVEQLAFDALGDAREAGSLLLHCFPYTP